jgi:hypothetical protein
MELACRNNRAVLLVELQIVREISALVHALRPTFCHAILVFFIAERYSRFRFGENKRARFG